MMRIVRLVLLVVNLFQLSKYHRRGNHAVPEVFIVTLVKAAQGWHTLQSVLHGSVGPETGEVLPVVANHAPGRLVLRQTAEMARRDGEARAEEVGMAAGLDWDDELEVAVFIAEVELESQVVA